MESSIQYITGEWQFWAFVLVIGLPYISKLFKYFSDKFSWKKPKENEQLKRLEEKFDIHSKNDAEYQKTSLEWRENQDLRSHGQKILNALALTSPSCKEAKFKQIEHEFQMYEQAKARVPNHKENGTVAQYYFDWLEKRENSLKNLRKKDNG